MPLSGIILITLRAADTLLDPSWINAAQTTAHITTLVNLTVQQLFWIFIRKKSDEEREHRKKNELDHHIRSAMGHLVSTFARELNNPIAIVAAKAHQLKKLSEEGRRDPKKIGAISDSLLLTAQRSELILKGLLCFAKDAANDAVEQVNVSKLITEVATIYSPQFEQHQVQIRFGKIPASLFVSARHHQLIQMFSCLFVLALDRVDDVVEKWVDFGVDQASGVVNFRVSVPGTLSRNDKLWLKTSRGLAENYGGGVGLGPSPSGTQIVLSLPLDEVAAAA